MNKTTTDNPAAQNKDNREQASQAAKAGSRASGQSVQGSRGSSQGRQIDMIPVQARQRGSASPQGRRSASASPQARKSVSASSQGRKSASASPQGRKSSSASPQARKDGARSSQKRPSESSPSQDRRKQSARRTVPAARQNRGNASPQRRGSRPASARRRRNRIRRLLSLAALIVMLLLCAILLVSGIRRFFKGKDKVPPVITLDHREDYVVMPWQEYEEEGFSASDDRDGDLTEQVSRTVTEDRICYRVSDSAGNESVLYRDIPYDTSYKEKTGKDFPEINIDDPDAQGKIVYLTFDDGPGPYTEELLETLDRYGVQVTFFVTGAFPAYEDMIKKEDAAGNSVGIHTLTHDFEKIYSDDKAFWKDIDQMQEIVQRQTGHTTNLMRFAGGSSNSISASYTPGIMTLLTEQAQQKGFQYFDWNISSGDGGSEGDMNMVINNITSNLPNQDTCVVLCHDTKEYTVNAMKYLIPWLLDHGYDIRPLQFDSEPAHHGVQN